MVVLSYSASPGLLTPAWGKLALYSFKHLGLGFSVTHTVIYCSLALAIVPSFQKGHGHAGMLFPWGNISVHKASQWASLQVSLSCVC